MRFRTMLIIASLLVSGVVAGTSRPVAAAEQCFPQTGKCVRGRFLDYWQANGALPINGYPITDERMETLEDGKQYLVQWFERVRLEYHPENSPPYDVLLGQFGRILHPADPPVPQQPGARHFPETGHNLAGDFLAYWEGNGGLAQFGYPLSEEIQEQLEDGTTYTVQYTERARLERHPENAPPYDVLLGQFGRRVLTLAPQGQPASYQVSAYLLDSDPPAGSSAILIGKLTNNGQGVTGAWMTTTWRYRTTTTTCVGGPSQADGLMYCADKVAEDSRGFTVVVDVAITYEGQTFTTTTSFTPR